jgi:adenosylcobyric acid synthase
VRWVTEPARLLDADLVVLPGSKATVRDLAWLRGSGMADAVLAHARTGRPVLGICGGYQMLGREIADPHGVEGGSARGLGLLDLDVAFDAEKHLGNPTGTAWGLPVSGYEIHHGRVTRTGDPALLASAGGEAGESRSGSALRSGAEGSAAGAVRGTHWHGLLENDGFRRELLRRVAAEAGRPGFVLAPDTSFAAARAAQLDLLGDLVEQHLDIRALEHVISHGTGPDLPRVTSGLAGSGA